MYLNETTNQHDPSVSSTAALVRVPSGKQSLPAEFLLRDIPLSDTAYQSDMKFEGLKEENHTSSCSSLLSAFAGGSLPCGEEGGSECKIC